MKWADVEAWDAAAAIGPCPLCKTAGTYRRIIGNKAPAGRVGGEGSTRQVVDMRKSLDERFWKKEADDVRHRHPEAFNDSIRGAAVKRIKEGIGNG